MRLRLRRLLKHDATFGAFLALVFLAIIRSVAEHQSPVEAYLWVLVLLVGAILMVDGLARLTPSDHGRVVSGRTMEEIRRQQQGGVH